MADVNPYEVDAWENRTASKFKALIVWGISSIRIIANSAVPTSDQGPFDRRPLIEY